MNEYLGELERSTSFKVDPNPDNVNAGLLTYPVLMAAIIFDSSCYKSTSWERSGTTSKKWLGRLK
jgi:tryptophanyl-tRNA synthetase